MRKHVISADATLYEALQAMNSHRVKFLIATDDRGVVTGTLTDGDIRRGLLNGMQLADIIDAALCKQFTAVSDTDGLQQVLTAFHKPGIEFLPVLNKDDQLCNIITRRALNVLLLQNKEFLINYDFSSIDENTLEHEIFARPWGFYKTTVLNNMYQAKVIYIMPGQALSLQSHSRREEHWLMVSGQGQIQIGDSVQPALPGTNLFIPKGCKHRMTNTSKTDILIISEVQLGDYFGEDDIQRLDDRYGRA